MNKYEICLMTYGLVAMLKVLQELEKRELFEECIEIREACKFVWDRNPEAPTEFSNDALFWWQFQFVAMNGKWGEVVWHNFESYVDDVYKQLEIERL